MAQWNRRVGASQTRIRRFGTRGLVVPTGSLAVGLRGIDGDPAVVRGEGSIMPVPGLTGKTVLVMGRG